MTKHEGEHPRMGATDVMLFVPIFNMTTEECVEISKSVAKRMWEELEIPVFLYEDSCQSEDRNIAQVFMNMVNYKGALLYRVYKTLRFEAERGGVNIIANE